MFLATCHMASKTRGAGFSLVWNHKLQFFSKDLNLVDFCERKKAAGAFFFSGKKKHQDTQGKIIN